MMSARRGQSIVEYTMIVGVITLVLFYMGTGIKRGVQSLVKITADQVGNQQNSDQDFNDTQEGYMIASNSAMQETNNKRVTDKFYVTNIAYNEYSDTITNTITNGGFAPNQPT